MSSASQRRDEPSRAAVPVSYVPAIPCPAVQPVYAYQRAPLGPAPPPAMHTEVTFVPFEFVQPDGPQPPRKKRRHNIFKGTHEELKAEQQRLIALRKERQALEAPQREQERLARDAERAKERAVADEELYRRRAEERETLHQAKVVRVLNLVMAENAALDRVWIDLLRSKDCQLASWVSRAFNARGIEIADAMVDNDPEALEPWVAAKAAHFHDAELKKIAKKLRPDQCRAIKAAFGHLAQWGVLDDIGSTAPGLSEILKALRTLEEPRPAKASRLSAVGAQGASTW